MYSIETYPDFLPDVKELWEDVILKYNFSVFQPEDEVVIIANQDCSIHVCFLGGQRINYFMENPVSGKLFPEVELYIFFRIKIDRNLIGGSNYPLSTEQWVDYYANDDFQSICKVDLPIIKEEITRHWQRMLEGDFSFEPAYLKWEKWYQSQKDLGIHYSQLSFEHYNNDQ